MSKTSQVGGMGFWTRVKVRLLGQVQIGYQCYLIYCGKHGYVMSYDHYGGPRCPVCDEEWLKRRMEKEEKYDLEA